jgi:membrane-associated protease RseP (regulator of RpoE activity)
MNSPPPPTEVFLATPGKPRERVRLGPAFNSGAAGSVHPIVGDPTRVVKLYNPETLQKEGKTYEAKVRAMIGHAPHLPVPPKVPGSLVKGDIIQIAWPVAVAQVKASFVGFAMPAIEVQHTAELEFVMQDKQARAHNLKCDLGSRLVLAHNLAAVVRGIHAQGHAVVDMKPVNMKFYKHELYMAVLDCDGFSISGFPAPQVTADYRAPEFFNKSILQPEAQDRFALAVIIFRLLNFGIHPYQGIPQFSDVPNEIEELIRNGLFAYGTHPNPQLMPVPASAHVSLPDELRQMFNRAFGKVTSERPSAQEWVQALKRFATESGKMLEPCGAGHLRFPGKPCGNCLRDAVMQSARTSSMSSPAPVQPPKPTQALPGQIYTPVPTKSRGLWKWLAFAMLCVAAFYWFRSPAPSPQPVIAEAVAKRPYYGMTFAEGSQDGKVYIAAVEAKGPAANAGLAAGDQVVALDGLEVSAGDDFKKVIAHSRPEHGYQLEVRRGNRQATGELIPEMIDEAEWSRRMSALQKTQLVAVLSSPPAPTTIKTPPASAVPPTPTLPVKPLPPPKMRAVFGMSLESAPYQNDVNVVSVARGGRAELAGIKLGDVIRSFDGIRINVPADMHLALDQVKDAHPVPVVIHRAGKTLALSVRPEMIDEVEWRRRTGNK